MEDLLKFIGWVLLPLCLILWTRGYIWRRRELQMLEKKYGDLPMFEDFFRRIRHEGRRRRERVP